MGYRGHHRHYLPVRYLQPGLSIEEILVWIDGRPEGIEAHQQNIQKFNDAINDLIAYGEPAVEPLISHLLPSNSRWMQWGAIWALQDIGDQRAVEPIWIILNRTKHDLGIQHYALLALGQLKDERIFEVALTLLKSENYRVRQSAIVALGNLGDRRATQFLIPLIEYPNSDRKITAIAALGNLEEESAVEPLIDQLSSTKWLETDWTIESLGKIGGEQAIAALKGFINSADIQSTESARFDRLRCNAVNALAQMNDPLVVPILEAALNHPKRGVRRHARKALEKYRHNNDEGSILNPTTN